MDELEMGFGSFDNGSDSGGDIGSTIFDSGLDLSQLASGFEGDIGNLGFTADSLNETLDYLRTNPGALDLFKAENPEEYALIRDVLNETGDDQLGGGQLGSPDAKDTFGVAEDEKLKRQAAITASGQNAVANVGPQGNTGVKTVSVDPNASTGVKSLTDTAKDLKKQFEDATGIKVGDAAATAAKLALMKEMFDYAKKDAEQRRKDAMGAAATGTGEIYTGKGRFSPVKKAAGGVMDLHMAKGRYLNGHSDGMADKVPAHIDGRRPAALSDGEFVIPADVVSHLGNGNSNAGAKRLYKMMDDIRAARTGNPKQGKQINPDKFMPR